MLHKLQVLAFTWALGVFSCCNAAAITHHDEPLKPGKPIGLHDLLTTGENVVNSAAQFQISGGPGVIHFLKVYFYNSNDCSNSSNNLLAVASVVDNVSGFSFANNQVVSFNANAAATLAANKGLTVPQIQSIQCIALYVDGGNSTSNAVNCTTYSEDCLSGTSCNSQSGINLGATWSTANHNSPCSTRNVYFVETNSGDNKVFKCSVNETNGLIFCDPGTTTGSTGSSGIAINNGYAYISNNSGDVIKCTVAVDGSINSGTCAATPSTGFFTNAAGITLNYKYAYVTKSTTTIPITYSIVRCDVSPTDGSINSGTCGTVASGSSFSIPSGMAISNGFNYITNTDTPVSTVIPCAVTPGTGDLSCNAATGSDFTAPLGIAISNSFAYVANSLTNNNTVTVSSVASGILSTVDVTPSVNSPAGIAINNAFAYITSAQTSGAILIYSINSVTGKLTAYFQQSVSTANTPKPITIY